MAANDRVDRFVYIVARRIRIRYAEPMVVPM